jgi:hypothetical protein
MAPVSSKDKPHRNVRDPDFGKILAADDKPDHLAEPGAQKKMPPEHLCFGGIVNCLKGSST